MPSTDLASAPESARSLAQNAAAPRAAVSIDTLASAGHKAERKMDGWRVLIHRDEDGVKFYSRAANRIPSQLPILERTLERLPVGTWLDSEGIVKTGEGERESFNSAASALGSNGVSENVTLVVFDLIAFDGLDTRALKYDERRSVLERLFSHYEFEMVELIEQVEASHESLTAALAAGYEGLITKDPNAPYKSGARGGGWTKWKPKDTLDAIVMGFNMSDAASHQGLIRSIQIGQFNADGELVKIADVSGMKMRERVAMSDDQDAWIGKVVEISYVEWHTTGGLKSPNFLRERPDKPADEVVLDVRATV